MSNRPVAKGGGGGKKPTYGYAPTPIGPDDGGKPKGLWIALGVLGLAAIIGVVVAVVATDDGQKESVSQPVEVSGTRLPPMPSGGTSQIAEQDPAAGLTIPKLNGKTFTGTPVKIEPGGGPQLIVFLAHWCPHCQAEVPKLVAARSAGTIPESLRVTAVSTGVDKIRGNYPPASWLKQENWTDPVIADDKDGKAGTAFGLGGFPYMLAVDADGKVVKRSSGELSDAQLQEMIAAATGETPAA
jgi:thiol-disulfide isomerase/thioredoxin